MGVAPTGAIFKGLTFDGESSKDYGIYITGSAVFNAPARDVEMITIPGRNGTFALDHGRFENIEVTYPAGVFGDTEADFAQGISDFRNFLASRQGYVELSDDYNPGEYRLAVYKSGLEVTPAQLKAGEFEIVFDCKPQRWLTAGQDPVSITSGDEITNPTLFDASPLLLVDGYGKIEIGDSDIRVQYKLIGTVQIADAVNAWYETTLTSTIASRYLNTGDTFQVTPQTLFRYSLAPTGMSYTVDTVSVTTTSDTFTSASVSEPTTGTRAGGSISAQNETFVFGTASSHALTLSVTMTYHVTATPQITGTASGSITVSLAYDGADTLTATYSDNFGSTPMSSTPYTYIGTVIGQSTKSALGNPLYIDLDIGEAYQIDGGEIVSSNAGVSIGATLPTLPPGNTTITFPSTITNLDIVPRWWKV